MSALMAVSALTENESLIFLTIILVDHCLHLVETNIKWALQVIAGFLNGLLPENAYFEKVFMSFLGLCHRLWSETFATVTLIRSVAFQVKG